jgi:excisionase family DNA binding protein
MPRASTHRQSIAATDPAPLLVSPRHAAQQLDVTTRTIHRLIAAKKLRTVKVGRSRRIVFASLVALAQDGVDQV